MRRPTVLLAVLVATAGLLSACDLPSGSPPILGPDRVPNDTQAEAPVLQYPALINGTVDESDQVDVYRLTAPPTERGFYLRCTGDPNYSILIMSESLTAASTLNEFCQGQERFIANVGPGSTIYISRLFNPEGPALQPYTVYASYGSAQGDPS